MSRMMQVSDELFTSAEAASEATSRSLSQQIEYWARIGRAVEALQFGATDSDANRFGRNELDAALAQVGTPEGIQKAQDLIRKTSAEIVSTDPR